MNALCYSIAVRLTNDSFSALYVPQPKFSAHTNMYHIRPNPKKKKNKRCHFTPILIEETLINMKAKHILCIVKTQTLPIHPIYKRKKVSSFLV